MAESDNGLVVIHISWGGPVHCIVDGKGKAWDFEDHPYCGPIVVNRKRDPVPTQPIESSAFWEAANLWYAQGKRFDKLGTCQWDKPTMQKMRHLGGKHYMLVTDDTEKEASNGR